MIGDWIYQSPFFYGEFMIHKFIKSKSRIATVMVGFNAGSRNEIKYKYNMGISHMLEHCFFKGTNKRNWENLLNDISYIGGSANAYTSYGKVAYMIDVPVENIDSATEIISDMILNLNLSEEEFAKEREVVMEEMISSSDSVSQYMWENLSDIFFDNYLANPIIGNEESISSFSKEEVERYYNQFCGTDQAVVLISGDMKKKDAMSVMKKYFGKPNGRIKRPKFKKSGMPESCIIEVEKPGIEHVYAKVCVPALLDTEKEKVISEVMNAYFGGGMNSKLFKEVREKRGLVYSISSHSTNFYGDGSIQSIGFSTREAGLKDAMEIIEKEIESLTENEISEYDLIRVKNQIKSSFYSFIECSNSLCSYELSRVINRGQSVSEHLAMMESVTGKDILEYAKKIYNKENVVVLLCRGEVSNDENE